MKLRLLRNATLKLEIQGRISPDRPVLCPEGIAAVVYRTRAQSDGRTAGKPGRNPRRRRTRHRLASACRPFRSGGTITGAKTSSADLPAGRRGQDPVVRIRRRDAARQNHRLERHSPAAPRGQSWPWAGRGENGTRDGLQHHGKGRADCLLGRRYRALSSRRDHYHGYQAGDHRHPCLWSAMGRRSHRHGCRGGRRNLPAGA